MLKGRLTIFMAVIIVVLSFTLCKRGNGKFDILIVNGKIVDGTGNPWFYGDLGIRGNTIVEIGNLAGRTAAKVIDAKGMIVSPGFIDMHTHCDRGLGEPDTKANLNYLTQGVTTVVSGNCGGSVSLKVAETKAKWEEQGIGTNAVFLVGHGTIRSEVMGMEPREAKAEEIEKMQAILRQAMEEGAWGMSTGLEYVPGLYANTEEIIALAKVVGEFGGIYSTHKRSEREYVREAVQETIRIGKEGGVRANISHLKLCGKNYWGLMKDVVKMVNHARAEGIYIVADMYPYDKASTGPISEYINVPEVMEPLAELRKKMMDRNLEDAEREKLREQYRDELTKALSDKSKRAQIKEPTVVGFPQGPSAIARWGWDSFAIVNARKNTHLIEKTLSDLAEEQKRDPFDILVDLFIEEGDDMHLSTGTMSEDDMKQAIKQDWLMFSSDADSMPIKREGEKPRPVHPRAYGSSPRVFRKYVREEKVLTLENAVKKLTSLPASLLQMKDRGLLVKGYKADIVIFDPETIRDKATYVDSHQYSTGIEYVIIDGKISIENGEYNSALNGKLLLLKEKR